MLDILQPYLSFIAFFIAIVLNVLLLLLNAKWYAYIIGNAIIFVVLTGLGITPYDFISDIIDGIVDIIKDIFDNIFTRKL